MKRIMLLGCSGAGKSTLARALGKKLNLPVIHLDAVFWKPGWQEPDKEEFDQAVLELSRHESWIIDGNYSRTLDARLALADLIIFLDFPRWHCLTRIVKRRYQYANRVRPDMSPGCPEKIDLVFLKWIWGYPRTHRPKITAKLQQYQERGKNVFVLRTPQEVRRFLAGL